MHERIVETHTVVHEADEDNAAAERSPRRRLFHRRFVSGRIEDDIEELIRFRHGLETELFRKLSADGIGIEYGDFAAREIRELGTGEANRPGPDDEHRLPQIHACPFHRMFADAERFDEGKLIERERFRFVQMGDGNRNEFPHAAIGMYAEAGERLAAVRPPGPAHGAFAAVQIRFHGAAIANLQAEFIRGNGFNFNAEFVAKNAGISEERLPAGKGVQVGAADADPPNADEGVPLWHIGRWYVGRDESAGFVKGDLEHGKLR